MGKISGTYQGEKRVALSHELSGAQIYTDAPPDNNGLGRSFSPTDLVAGALGACVMTIISITAERLGIELSDMNFEVEKQMQASPRRISKLVLSVHLPFSLEAEERLKLERAGNSCPVHRSLHPEIEAPIEYTYDL